jgi:DNA mismatch repair protein MutL
MTIRLLSADVANKIAAGEVVERPASVVKELVENAIDAGAQTIRVEIRGGGKQLIRVLDDGQGIPAEEVPLAFTRHATSKLTTIEDLSRVTTLGFRGEALASIAAVSQLTCLSRPKTQTAAMQIRLEGGFQVSLGAAGAPAGTIISVENLFYNVPARLKFIKAEATEAGHIYRVVSYYALAHPEIRFSLQTDNRQTFQTNGSGELLDTLVSVMGLDTAREMLAVGETEPDAPLPRIYGYIGTPALSRGTRDQMIFFVNKRWIQDRALSQAVIQAYHTFLQVNRFPVAVLNIELDPSEVDVNVHPTKAEVKFQEPRQLFSLVQKAVREAIVAYAPAATSFQSSSHHDTSGHGHTHWQPSSLGGNRTERNQFGLEIQRPLDIDTNESGERSLISLPSANTAIPMMRVIGQIRQMYIIAEGPDGMYLIDQHAAHERVLYEKMAAQKAASEVIRQQLLEPLIVEFTPAQAAIVKADFAALTEAGFELEPFGGNTYRLRAMPDILGQAEPVRALLDILDEMADGAIPLAREIHEKIAITVCKRASVKGGQILSQEEMRELVRQLEATSAPRTCPHGRPTMIHLSLNELAKQFGRI